MRSWGTLGIEMSAVPRRQLALSECSDDPGFGSGSVKALWRHLGVIQENITRPIRPSVTIVI